MRAVPVKITALFLFLAGPLTAADDPREQPPPEKAGQRAAPASPRPAGAARWEYRVLTKEQIVAPSPDQDAQAENWFRRQDRNADGLLNADEMPDALKSELATWDQNGDGFIDLNEFKAFHKAYVQRNQASGNTNLTAGLNRLGTEGWELLTIQGTGASAEYYFKRPAGKAVATTSTPPSSGTGEMKIFMLKSMSAVEAARMLQNLLGNKREGSLRLAADAATNQLVVHASPVDLQAIEAVLARLDVPADAAPRLMTKAFVLKHVTATAAAKALQEVLRPKNDGALRIAAVDRTNQVVVQGTQEELIRAAEIITQIDVPAGK